MEETSSGDATKSEKVLKVSNENQLWSAREKNAPFQFFHYNRNFISLNQAARRGNYIENLMEALKHNTNITSIEFFCGMDERDADLFRSMMRINKTIKKITIVHQLLKTEPVKILSEILRSNLTIKKFTIVWNNRDLENYLDSGFQILSEGLGKSTIMKLILQGIPFNQSHIDSLAKILSGSKFLTHLELTAILRLPPYKQDIIKPAMLTMNNLISLKLDKFSLTDPESALVADLLKTSKNLRELMLIDCNPNWTLIQEGLEVNTTLESLILEDLYDSVIPQITKINKSLKKLSIKTNRKKIANFQPILGMLKDNYNLRALNLKGYQLVQRDVIKIARLLTPGYSLQILTFDVPKSEQYGAYVQMLDLKNNDTLTELNLGPCWTGFSDFNLPVGNLNEILLDVLSVNESLCDVTFQNEKVSLEVHDLLESNKAERSRVFRNAILIVNIIAMRPNQFEAILPLDIWAVIFKWIRHPGLLTEFDRLFWKQLKHDS
jgi:hypothetical protein